jgi:hypothetical protein
VVEFAKPHPLEFDVPRLQIIGVGGALKGQAVVHGKPQRRDLVLGRVLTKYAARHVRYSPYRCHNVALQ